jgi:hypothetical protein
MLYSRMDIRSTSGLIVEVCLFNVQLSMGIFSAPFEESRGVFEVVMLR